MIRLHRVESSRLFQKKDIVSWRIFERLRDEHGFTGGYTIVKDYVRQRRLRMREMFDFLSELGVEGMMVSPGYPYEKAPDQEHFLHRNETVSLFRKILSNPKRRWRFNQSPLFLEFLKGNWDLECTPWEQLLP